MAKDVYWSVSCDASDTASKLCVAEVAEVSAVCRTLRQTEEVFLSNPTKLVERRHWGRGDFTPDCRDVCGTSDDSNLV